MQFAVSNIAWASHEEEGAYDILRQHKIRALEIAPTRWWSSPLDVSEAAFAVPLLHARSHQISVVAFQAILFGREDLTLFGSPGPLADYLAAIARRAAACGATRLVLGAPRNRRRPISMTEEEAEAASLPFFSRIAEAAASCGVTFCLEPNPEVYGCNFATHTASAARLVSQVNSPGLLMQIDAGALAINAEEVSHTITQFADLIGHVHVSQPMLGDFQVPWGGHKELADALREIEYQQTISLEMKRQDDLALLNNAVEFMVETYGAI